MVSVPETAAGDTDHFTHGTTKSTMPRNSTMASICGIDATDNLE
jgi:hypothetical protein